MNLTAGGFSWNILFIVTENRCNSGMFSMIKKKKVVLYNKSEILMVYINLYMQRNGAKLFAVGTGASLVSEKLTCFEMPHM
jgi:hypothetical protein